MEVYILRHAIAVERGTPGYPNDDRPLTPEGIEKMEKAAKGIAALAGDFDVILTSPLVRARETAEITARAMQIEDRVLVTRELLPSAQISEMNIALMRHRDKPRVLIVGHEPNLSMFASYLLGGNRSAIELKKGAFCRIDIDHTTPREPGVLICLLPPKILRSIAKSFRTTSE